MTNVTYRLSCRGDPSALISNDSCIIGGAGIWKQAAHSSFTGGRSGTGSVITLPHPPRLISHLPAGRGAGMRTLQRGGEDDGMSSWCRYEGGGGGEHEGLQRSQDGEREREKMFLQSVSAVTLRGSQSSGCRVSDAALLHNGPFPCRRKARTVAELFSSADASAGGKIGSDLPSRETPRAKLTHTILLYIHTLTHRNYMYKKQYTHKNEHTHNFGTFTNNNTRTWWPDWIMYESSTAVVVKVTVLTVHH